MAIGPARDDANSDHGYVADFSSRGLAFDGGVKPNVAAPGVAIATSEPGAAPDGTPVYGTVNGTSAAAATVAGGAALLAEMRPALDGPSLQSLLVGYAQGGRALPMEAGAGMFGSARRRWARSRPSRHARIRDLGGPALARDADGRRPQRPTRRLQLSISVVSTAESEALGFKVTPDRLCSGSARPRG